MNGGDDALQRIVANPQESLETELKPWLDPTNDAHAARIAKTCIALRNNNGGRLVLGFEDNCERADSPPSDPRQYYHVDLFQQIVSRYASEPFAVSIEFREVNNVLHPIVVVPNGVERPVFSKSSFQDNDSKKKTIEDDAIYVRSITSNNRVSSTKLRRGDIDRLMKICFDNREADIGAFIRRHLVGSAGQSLINALLGVASEVDDLQSQVNLLDEGYEAFLASLGMRGRGLPEIGFYEVAAKLHPIESPLDANGDLLFRLKAECRDYSGWPPWTVIDTPQEPEMRPYVRRGSWEAIMDNRVDFGFGPLLDFWIVNPAGKLYYLRALEDDMLSVERGIAPRTVLDFYIVAFRSTEVIAAVLDIANILVGSSTCSIDLEMRWTGLRDRVLSCWSNPGRKLRTVRRAHDDKVTTSIHFSSDTPISSVPSLVHESVHPLYLAFDGYDLPKAVIEEIAAKVLHTS